ncbi:Putative ripening-related protein 2 [Linum grandiflorum]
MKINFIVTSPMIFILLLLHPLSPNAVVQARHLQRARLTLVSFSTVWQDGGWATPGCDSATVVDGDNDKVVVVSSAWYDKGNMCNKFVKITGGWEGRTVTARVVGECDTSLGCDGDVIDASRAVWKGLRIPSKEWGRRRFMVTWFDVNSRVNHGN